MAELQVEYRRQQKVDDTEKVSVGGSISVEVPEDADLQSEWTAVFAVLRSTVDQALGFALPQPDGSSPDEPATPKVSQDPSIVEDDDPPPNVDPDTPIRLTACRVQFGPEQSKDRTGRDYARIRIGHDDVPGRYVHIKSYDPEVMGVIKQLRKGDAANVEGSYEKPWRGSDNKWKFALIVTSVERV